MGGVRFESEDSASRPADETTPTAGTTRRSSALLVLARRLLPVLATWPVIGAGVVVAVVGFALVERTAPCSDFSFGVQDRKSVV